MHASHTPPATAPSAGQVDAVPADLAAVAREIGFAQCARGLRSVLLTTPLGWVLVAWFAWMRAPHAHVLAWLGGFLCSWLVTLALLRAVVRAGPDLRRHHRHLAAIAALDGVAWGSPGWPTPTC